MNTNGTNPGMNVDDYENMAVQKSNTAKRVAAGAALLAGGAVAGGGAAYAASEQQVPNPEEVLTSDDVVDGANAGKSYQETEEPNTETVTERVVYVEKPVEHVEEEKEPTVTWDEKTIVYDGDGNVTGSMESGTVNGNKFVLMDVDGDDHADVLAIDMDGNGRFDDNEVVKYDVSDHVHMGHETAHTREIHNNSTIGEEPSEDSHWIAYRDGEERPEDRIHNNFEDEKTGESYHGDYAENNPDYNPNADVNDYGEGNNYLAENDAYDVEEDSYSAEVHEDYLDEAEEYDDSTTENYMADANVETDDETLESSADYTAEAEQTESYDEMVGGEEFLG